MSQKNVLIRGTLILTISGLLTRILGFFYRIYLADALGAEALGIYQLVFPVYGICFTLFAAGNQTALSKMVASHEPPRHKRLLSTTLLVSLSIALLLCAAVIGGAPLIASRFLLEPRSAASLRILAYTFPFCAVTACTNGYYYGRKKAGVPAATQFLEQTVRLAAVFLLTRYAASANLPFTCEMAVFGLLAGEIASMIFNAISMIFGGPGRRQKAKWTPSPKSSVPIPALHELGKISIPITANRFTINLLHSVEMILLPSFLRLSGASASEALSLYGILNGMSMPFILFPSTVTNSLSVMLLPAVADASSKNEHRTLGRTIGAGLRYSLLISVLCTGVFMVYGYDMGNLFFHSPQAGSYIRTLSWLCPFLYLNTTLGSILNGLDLAPTVFLQNVIASSVRIAFLLFLVPEFGMTGYLWGMLAGSLCLTLLHGYTLFHKAPSAKLPLGLVSSCALLVAAGLFLSKLLPLSFLPTGLPQLFARCLFVCLLFLFFFLYTEKKLERG